MEKKLILRGLLSGGIAGLIAFVFARIFAEPQIQKAIDYESARDSAQAKLDKAAGLTVAAEGHDPFSRAVQSLAGIGTGMIVMGIALGGLYAVAYCIAYGRVGAVKARALTLAVALAGFLTVFLVPFAKYPANPPAIGHEETIGPRTALFVTMVVASLLLGIAAVVAGRRLRRSYSAWTSTLLAGAGFVILIGVLMAILPSVGELGANVKEYGVQASETPLPLKDPSGDIVFPGFPADVLALFRVYSIGAQAILWGALGLIFGPLAERVLERSGQPASTQSPQKVRSDATR